MAQRRSGGISLYVCLCAGATCAMVAEAVARGASTSKEIAAACGAGRDCGRCRRTLRAAIDAGRADHLSLDAQAV